MSHFFTAVTDAVFPYLEKAVSYYAHWHWLLQFLALAFTAIIAYVFACTQLALRAEYSSLLPIRRLLRYLVCALPGWYIMRHFPQESLTGAWPVLLGICFLLAGVLILSFLFTRHIWRIPQLLFNLAVFLMLGTLLSGLSSRRVLSAILFLVPALLGFLLSWAIDSMRETTSKGEKHPEPTAAPSSKPDGETNPAASPAVSEPVKAKDPAPKPASEEKPAPAEKPAPKPAAEEKPAPAEVPVPKPAAEEKPAPAEKPAPRPAAEEKPVPAEKPAPKPAAEEKPAPAEKPAPRPAAEEKPAPAEVPVPKPAAEEKPAPAEKPAPRPVAEEKPAPAEEPAAEEPAEEEPVISPDFSEIKPLFPPHLPLGTKAPDELRNLTVSIIGPYQTGKTTLAAAISRVLSVRYNSDIPACSLAELDALPEEKERKETIEVSCFECRTADTHFTVFDCPGSTMYTRRTLAALSQSDLAILVFPAGADISQRFEDIVLTLGAYRLPFLLVLPVLDPTVDKELLYEQDDWLTYTLENLSMDQNCIYRSWGLPIAALDDPYGFWGDEILSLMKKAEEVPSDLYSDRPFHMPVLQSFLPAGGQDPVVTGCIRQGSVSVGDTVQIAGLKDTGFSAATVRQIQSFGRDRQYAEAGDSVGLRLHTGTPERLHQGQVLFSPASRKTTDHFAMDVFFYRRGNAVLYRPGQELMVQLGTACVCGKMEDRDEPFYVAGHSANVSIRLDRPAVLRQGDPVILCLEGALIGRGTVSDIL